VTQVSEQSDPLAFSGRLRQRLTDLGAAVVSIGLDGVCELIGSHRWEHGLIVRSAPFAASVRSQYSDLSENVGSPVNLWPGLVLVPMQTTAVHGQTGSHPSTSPMMAALLMGKDILGAEQLARVCDSSETDLQVVVSRFDADTLMSDHEINRMAQVIGWMARDAADLGWRLHELHDLSWELAGSYEELSLLYKLSTSMVVNHPPQAFLEQTCAEIREVVGLRWLAIQLSDTEPGFTDLSVPVCVDCPTSYDLVGIRKIGIQLLDVMNGRTEPVILDDARVLGIPGLEKFAHSLLVTPLHVDGKLLGLLYGADKIDAGSGFSTVDSKLCASLGSSLSIYLKNVLLYEDMHSMFMGTLHALSATIDAKDSYTQGHSERVALMAKYLAEAAGLDSNTVERIYLSGLVHDVGKIGVPEAVLTKPGKLTKEEYDLVKKHPEIGALILKDIRQMQDLIPGVLYHHESWDGNGYPHGLAGKDIPLFGRIIGLADAFDAMSSDRTYRQAMPMHKVLDEVRRCSGKQFDPELADIFVKLDFTTYLEMIEERRNRRLSA
jgi:HD-GYP domain-containing protein (c-di-GMP phosphodiesterase class II)